MGKSVTTVISVLLGLAVSVSGAYFPSPPAALTRATHTLAPRMKASDTASMLIEADEEEVFAYFEKIVNSGHRPTLILDKDGTITPKNGEISAKMARRIVLLLHLGCNIAVLSANSINNINAQFTDILIKRTIPEMRARPGYKTIDTSILERLIIMTNSGSSAWEFDSRLGKYINTRKLKVEPVFYGQVKDSVHAVRNFFTMHPLYRIGLHSQMLNSGVQLTLSSMLINSQRNEKKDFDLTETDTMRVLGYTKRQIWTETIQEVLASYKDGYSHELHTLLNEYKICLSQTNKRHMKKRMELVLAKEKYSYFRDSTLAKVMLNMLDVREGNTKALLRKCRNHISILKALLRKTTKDLDKAKDQTQNKTLLRKTATLNKLIKYWEEFIHSVKFMSSSDVTLSHHLTAVKALTIVASSFDPETHHIVPLFVENGGNTSIDIKFVSKGQSIARILELFNAPSGSAIYYGDEFLKDGGDITVLNSMVPVIINVGHKLKEQTPAVRGPTRLCTHENEGPRATGRHFERFIEIMTSNRNQILTAA